MVSFCGTDVHVPKPFLTHLLRFATVPYGWTIVCVFVYVSCYSYGMSIVSKRDIDLCILTKINEQEGAPKLQFTQVYRIQYTVYTINGFLARRDQSKTVAPQHLQRATASSLVAVLVHAALSHAPE